MGANKRKNIRGLVNGSESESGREGAGCIGQYGESVLGDDVNVKHLMNRYLI